MKRIWIAFALLAWMTTVARAEDKAPKPGPENQRLGFYVGEWKTTGETKETPFGPAGKFTYKEKCEWFSGKFAVICYYGVDNTPMAMPPFRAEPSPATPGPTTTSRRWADRW